MRTVVVGRATTLKVCIHTECAEEDSSTWASLPEDKLSTVTLPAGTLLTYDDTAANGLGLGQLVLAEADAEEAA